MNCHRRCSSQVGNLCGLNQKDMAKELGKLGLTPEALQGNAKGKKFVSPTSSVTFVVLASPEADGHTRRIQDPFRH